MPIERARSTCNRAFAGDLECMVHQRQPCVCSRNRSSGKARRGSAKIGSSAGSCSNRWHKDHNRRRCARSGDLFFGDRVSAGEKYAPRLQRIADQWKARGVVVIGVDSNLQDTARRSKSFGKLTIFGLPSQWMPINEPWNCWAARRTPEVVVLDRRRAIRYQGRIDDQYLPGLQNRKPQCMNCMTP